MSAGPEEIARAVAHLRAGGLVAFPTETVYGLGAPAYDAAAVAKIFEIKGRPARNPLIVHVSGVDMARRAAATFPRAAQRAADAFWPGPLTLVLPRDPRLPDIVTGGGSTVGLRCPDHPLTLALIDTLGEPIVGPSANLSGSVSPTRAEHVRADFGDTVFVLDGGPCGRGIESTVLDLSRTPHRILRPGFVDAAALSSILQTPVAPFAPEARQTDAPLPSPGLLERHYAPRTPAFRFASDEWNDVAGALRQDAPVVLLTLRDRVLPPPHRVVRMPGTAPEYARALYSALREADESGAPRILIEMPGTAPDPLWDAIRDRLSRASSPVRRA